jgi:hypothetical protein
MTQFPLFLMEGETTQAKQLLIMDVCSFLFIGRSDMSNTYKRKTNRASWSQEDIQCAGEAFLEKRLPFQSACW